RNRMRTRTGSTVFTDGVRRPLEKIERHSASKTLALFNRQHLSGELVDPFALSPTGDLRHDLFHHPTQVLDPCGADLINGATDQSANLIFGQGLRQKPTQDSYFRLLLLHQIMPSA